MADDQSSALSFGEQSLRILFCTWGYGRDIQGGAERQAQLQAEEIARLGHVVDVVCPRWPGSTDGDINGVHVTRLIFLNRRPIRTVSYAVALACFLAINIRRYDLVHVHLAYIQADVVSAMARLWRVPVWVKLAASGPFGEIGRMRRVSVITRWIGIRWASRVQALSPAIAAEVRSLGVEPSRIEDLPNGVDLARFKPPINREKADLRDQLGLPEGAVCVLFVGRLAKHKGIPELLQAWSRIGPSDARLLLVGTRDTMDPIGEIGRDPTILTRSWTDHTEDYYRAADIFVLPSHVEGMSNALLEAMACGLPSIVSTVGANEELVQQDVDGFLIHPGDTIALEAALRRLLSDSSLRQRLGAAARARSAGYSIQSVAERLLDRYRDMFRVKC